MTKKGFTLVELMVVIIIMGLLAAVGVPKLTGVIAKSRATEVQPAAATYIKLQKAFINEKGGVGSWKKIGYAGPGKKTLTDGVATYRTTYFSYGGADLQISSTLKPKFPETVGEEGKIGWVAENLSGLNECAAGNKWVVKIYAVNDTTVEYRSESLFASNCSMLVSNWNQSDFGVTFGAGSPKVKAEDPPGGVAQSSASTTSSSSAVEDEVITALQCHSNGWLQGQKNGWKCKSGKDEDCQSEKAICFQLRQDYYTDGKLTCVGNDKGIVDGIEVCNAFVYTAKGASTLFFDGEKVVCNTKKNVTTHGNNPTGYCALDNWILATGCEEISSSNGVEYCAKKGDGSSTEEGTSSASTEGESASSGVSSSSTVSKCDETYSLNGSVESAQAFFGEKAVCSSTVTCSPGKNGGCSCENWRCASRCVGNPEKVCNNKNVCLEYCSSFN